MQGKKSPTHCTTSMAPKSSDTLLHSPPKIKHCTQMHTQASTYTGTKRPKHRHISTRLRKLKRNKSWVPEQRKVILSGERMKKVAENLLVNRLATSVFISRRTWNPKAPNWRVLWVKGDDFVQVPLNSYSKNTNKVKINRLKVKREYKG